MYKVILIFSYTETFCQDRPVSNPFKINSSDDTFVHLYNKLEQ